jgi:flavin-dependent dehydrogenase
VLLAGDSAGLADPVTAEGISHAIASGQIAARALLGGRLEPGAVARDYRRGLECEILRELRLARPLAQLLYHHPRLRRLVFRRAGKSICPAITDVIVGQSSYRRLLGSPANYFKLLRRVALP